MPRTLHPIDALIRRVQRNRKHPNRRLDALIARTLHGAENVYRKGGDFYRLCHKAAQIDKPRVTEYCASETAQRRAVVLLRRKRDGKPLSANRPAAPPLKEAA